MALDADPTFWKQIASWLWAPFGALIALVYANLQDKVSGVKKIAEGALPRHEWEAALSESRGERANLRGDIKELYGENAALRELINNKADEVARRMDDKMDRLRTDFTAGLNSIRDLMASDMRRRGGE